MTKKELFENIKKKKSFLCIGLDADITKVPKHLLNAQYPLFEFNKQLIDATKDICVAYKPNTAFYESRGDKGIAELKMTLDYLNDNHPDIFTILDVLIITGIDFKTLNCIHIQSTLSYFFLK